VIGLYKPSKNGISERLVNVRPKTELYDVPIPVTDDAQFVIAYSATMERDKVNRANPIQICGHKRLRFIKNDKHKETSDVMIHYRGVSAFDLSSRHDRNNALYLPDYQVEAKRVLRDANQTSKRVPTPLTRTKFVGGSNSQPAEPSDERETER
jgi:hypothetical protein